MTPEDVPYGRARVYGRCWACASDPAFGFVDDDCEKCHGTGRVPISVLEAMHRHREFLGSHHPLADANGNEKWARLAAEIPPEVFQLAMKLHRDDARRHSISKVTAAGLIRKALLTFIEVYAPEDPEVIEGAAEELTETPLLDEGPGWAS